MEILNNIENEMLEIPPIRRKSTFLDISEMQKKSTTNKPLAKRLAKKIILQANQNSITLVPIRCDMQA